MMVDRGNTDKHRTGITGNGLKGFRRWSKLKSGEAIPPSSDMGNSTPRRRRQG